MITGPHRYLRARSLRWRLLRLVTLASLLVWVLAAVLGYRQAESELREMLDAQMDRAARMLLAQAQFNESHLADLPANMAALRGARSRREELPVEFQIGRDDGTLLARSGLAPRTPLDAAPGFANVTHESRPWRSLILTTARGDYRIQVLQSIARRERQVLEMAAQAVIPLFVLFPLLLGLIYVSVRRGLEPLDKLARDVAARSLDKLEPVTGHAAPLEARHLVDALNDLLRRLAVAREHERRFTADAAHELRTPLAAVKVQAQVARISSDARVRSHALEQVLAGTDRATHLVDQLLRMARLDPLARLPDAQTVDLGELARRVVVEMGEATPAVAPRIDLAVGDEPVAVAAERELLAAALRNLLDNALRYTPPASRVSVYARRTHGEVLLGVADEGDDGDGMPPAELARLGERFYRGSAVSAEGSGLGLAIAQRIAELHGACLEIANQAGGGLDARLRWPATAAEAAETTR
ncbi:MAG: ATP-binding protein [Propionivibrio sp.]